MDKGEISDGYHSFNELYEHRHALFAVACHFLGGWKSKQHHDGTMFPGWFIAGLTTSEGAATYHLPLRLWDAFPGRERDKAPEWDGHTAADVATRLWAHVEAMVEGNPSPGTGGAEKWYCASCRDWKPAIRVMGDLICACSYVIASYKEGRSPLPLVAGAGAPTEPGKAFNFRSHLARQAAFSAATFGPGARIQGVTDHIRKELAEVVASGGDLKEWIDVVILALDGAWRSGASPEEIIAALVAKQEKNEARKWPDWRTADPNKAIEHDRSGEAAPPPAEGGTSPSPSDRCIHGTDHGHDCEECREWAAGPGRDEG